MQPPRVKVPPSEVCGPDVEDSSKSCLGSGTFFGLSGCLIRGNCAQQYDRYYDSCFVYFYLFSKCQFRAFTSGRLPPDGHMAKEVLGPVGCPYIFGEVPYTSLFVDQSDRV